MTATVIKSAATTRHPHAAAFNFDDLATQADRYLSEVRSQAAKILADANREANAIRAQAEVDGRQAAVAAAEKVLDEKVSKQMKTLLPALAKAIDSVEQAKTAWLTHWEQNVVRLATKIAARVVRKELVADPQIPEVLLREALELSLGGAELMIRLSPDDHAALGKKAAKMAAEFGRLAKTEIVADPQITPGGCRIETQFGSIDQTFEAQLARIEEELS
jgi:flagellar biosynthesis/type III secretory pathway protein FliH